MVIKWSDLAKLRLREIALYYKEERGVNVAIKVVSQIKKATNALKIFPYMAATEPALEEFPEKFRSLVVSDIYKVVYYVDRMTIRIITVFDCRQDPIKLKKDIKK